MTRREIIKQLFHGDVSVWIILLLLCCFSIVEGFSASSTLAYRHSNILLPIIRHSSFLFLGVVLTIALSHVHYKYFSLAILLLPFAALLLLITPYIGVTVNNSARFLDLFGFQFQPSEIAKLACIIYLAFWLSKRGKMSDNMIYKIILWGIVPVCLLITQANFSTGFMLSSVCFLMMFIGHIPLKKLGSLLFFTFIALLLGSLLICVIPTDNTLVKRVLPRADTWKKRVTSFVDPPQLTEGERLRAASEAEIARKDSIFILTDDNRQNAHAKIAIARGGLIGKGPGQSAQRDILPQAYDDFIYAVIVEELGIIFGGLAVLILYIMLMIRVGIVARKCEGLFPQYLVLGCGMMIVIQALTHIAVSVNLIPVTGQPLPLISRGGTSIIMTCAYIGIILSISHFGAKMDVEEDKDEPEGQTEELEAETESEGPEGEQILSTLNQTDA
ncbi:MAG: FtsW/RodA/SpoVE family cell cycle protein [Tannerella sp.]|jgi:cell division protein FtsW|nr:FtsW/RodA/SpoVE family cell cycle protein [Tannerella sp.]